MASRSRRPWMSSSSSTAKKPSAVEDSGRNIVSAKPQLAKKRPALVDITNRRDRPQSASWIVQSRPMVPCTSKVAKRKDSSTCTHHKDPSGKISPANLCVKSDALPCKCTILARDDPTARVSEFSLPSCMDIVLPTSRSMDVSPSKSVCGSVSLDETMSTSDSLKSSEFEYSDNEDDSVVKPIERKTNSNLFMSVHAQDEGKVCERNILLDMESVGNMVEFHDNSADPQFCATIASDIYLHLRASEGRKRPSVDFMERVQKDINASMRAILIDWLVEVAEENRLLPETLFLAVNYIDRYLSGNAINRQRLQLLGVACMMIAAKYEEICAPQVEEFCYLTDNTYMKEEVLQMESAVLNHLKFEMTVPTTKCFLRQFVHAAQRMDKVPPIHFECLANYIVELSLLEYRMLRHAPSLIAASATFLAKFILSPSKKPWDSKLCNYTLYQPSDLFDCVKELHHLFRNGGFSNMPAIREKYSQHMHKFVAKKYCPASIPVEFFQNS